MKKILLYGTTEENLNEILPVAQKSGAVVHFLKNEDLHKELIEVLEGSESLEFENPEYNMSLCLFAGYNREEIFAVIGELTEKGVKKPVFATVTQNNINWKIGRLMVDVNEEHIEMQKLSQKGNA